MEFDLLFDHPKLIRMNGLNYVWRELEFEIGVDTEKVEEMGVLNKTGLLKSSAVTWAEIQLNESRVTHLLCAFVEDAGANGRRSIKKDDPSRPSVDAFAGRKITMAL